MGIKLGRQGKKAAVWTIKILVVADVANYGLVFEIIQLLTYNTATFTLSLYYSGIATGHTVHLLGFIDHYSKGTTCLCYHNSPFKKINNFYHIKRWSYSADYNNYPIRLCFPFLVAKIFGWHTKCKK